LCAIIVPFGHGATPEIFILVARRQGFDIDRRRTGCEVEVADQIDVAPGDGRCTFENFDGFQVACCQLLLVYPREEQCVVGVNPTLTLVANSSGLKLQGGEMGTSSLSQRCSARPGCDSQEVDCGGSYDMLQVGFGKTSVAGATYSAASDRLGMSTFHTCPCVIGLSELLRDLSRSHLLECFMIFAGLETNEAGFLL